MIAIRIPHNPFEPMLILFVFLSRIQRGTKGRGAVDLGPVGSMEGPGCGERPPGLGIAFKFPGSSSRVRGTLLVNRRWRA